MNYEVVDFGEIDLSAVTQKLGDEGIEKFNKAYDKLLEVI
jgi:hypothetical protein